MTKYTVSYEKNDIPQVLIIEAENGDTARAWFEETKFPGEIYGVHEALPEDIKPGVPVLSVPSDYVHETYQEKAARENREYCQRIADELEMYTEGNAYKCPHCGEVHNMDEYEETEHEDEDGYIYYNCPCCKKQIEEDDLEAVDIYNYLEDVLEYEITINSRFEYQSCCVWVALGGPSVWIDTSSNSVQLRWGGESAQEGISSDAADAIDEYFEELYNNR